MREKVFMSLLLTAALVLVCFLGLLFYISSVELPQPVERTTEPYTEAVLYENGLMWVREKADMSSGAIRLPAGAVLNSLRIEDPGVSGFVEIVPENEGIRYRVESEDGVFEGDYLWDYDGFLAIESEGRTLAINKAKIKSYSYVPELTGESGLELFNALNESATISYLVEGAEFGVRYVIDGSHIEAMADIRSPIDLMGAKLTLRSGMPSDGAVYRKYMAVSEAAPVPAPLAAPVVETLGREFEFYSFVIDRIDLKANALISLKLFDGDVRTEAFYYWSGGTVDRRVRINNTLSDPLPSGSVNYYDNATWVGSSYMPYIAEGKEDTITVGYSRDIKVEKNLTSSNVTKEQKTYEYTVRATNDGPAASKVVLEQTIPNDAELISTQPRADVVGKRITWEPTLAPKESRTFIYSYKVIPRS
jgi:hypothetical protein